MDQGREIDMTTHRRLVQHAERHGSDKAAELAERIILTCAAMLVGTIGANAAADVMTKITPGTTH